MIRLHLPRLIIICTVCRVFVRLSWPLHGSEAAAFRKRHGGCR